MMTDDTTTTPAQASMAADAREQLVTELVTRAHAEGGDLVGPDGLLAEVTKRVLETGLEVEMSEHLGYDKSRRGGPQRRQLPQRHAIQDGADRHRPGRHRRATRPRRQLRTPDGEETPRRLGGVDAMVISLCATGLTTGEISAHLAEVYGADVSRETI